MIRPSARFATLTSERLWLTLILAGYLLLALIYSLTTPLFEASDELWHYPMVRYIAEHGALPVQDPANPGAWRQEGSQPPLYYMLGAALTFWIDTRDMPEVRRINPHADIGVVVPDGNVNMVVHAPGREAWPWSGTVLAMRLVRFLSIAMGAGTVYFTHRLGRELFPVSPAIGLAAGAFTAFNPMFLFISAVINNDNFSTLLASALLVIIVRLVIHWDETPPLRVYVLLGLLAGAGMLAKYQIGFVLPLIALALLAVSLRTRSWRPVVVGGAIAGGLTILIAGWWYWRNYDLYGDATGINVFLDIVGRRAVPADLAQLWTERETFMMSFWGFFGGVNVPMSDGLYTLFNIVAGLAVVGLLLGLALTLYRRWRGQIPALDPALTLARAFAVIWPVIVFISLLTWTRQTWASQGRLWFSAIAALSVWLAVGLANWSPWSPAAARINLSVAAVVFVAVAAVAPFSTIRPAYQLDRTAGWGGPTQEIANQALITACFSEPGSADDSLCLAGHPVGGSVAPGDYVRFAPALTATGPLSRDWSTFVHLVDQDGIIEAQRDVYPGGGLLATSDLSEGEAWRNRIAVQIPEGIYTPQTLDVYLGFYDLTSPTFERMIPAGATADPEARRVYLGNIRLEAPEGTVPNPVDVDFGGELTLLGYEIADRSLAPGESTPITLYWRAARRLSTDYVVSVQIIEPATLTKAAQLDAPPDPPASAWSPGETVTDTRTLTVAEDAPPGRYRVLVRAYPAGDAAHPLRVRGEAGTQSEDFVWLSWVQVEPR